MNISKKLAKNSRILKAISDPCRLAVLYRLVKKDAYVGEFKKSFKIEPTLLSHHLAVLKSAGLIKSKREAKRVLYSLIPGVKVNGRNPGLKLGEIKFLFVK
jgi:ArsR family transcriptional regulator